MKDSEALLRFRPWTPTWWASWPDPLRLDLRAGGWQKHRRVLIAFAIMAVGLAVALVPAAYDQRALGSLSQAGENLVPTLCFLVGDACLAIGVWMAAAAAQGKPLQGLFTAALGIGTAALAGPCAQRILQVAVLRDFYRPALLFTSSARAAAVVWGALLVVAVLAGVLAPSVLALASLLAQVTNGRTRLVTWLNTRRWYLLLPFAALAFTAIVTRWVLPSSLAAAMGYAYPAESGGYATISLRILSPMPWVSLQLLAGLPLVVGMWEGVEAARFCHRLAKRPDGITDTRLLKRVRRLGYGPVAFAVLLPAMGLAIARGQLEAVLAGLAVMMVTAVSLGGGFGRIARVSLSFERRATRWALPEEWREVGPISLVLVILALPVLGLLVTDLVRGGEAGYKFPADATNFYFYWYNYGITHIPEASAGGIFGHIESVLWRGVLALAVVLLFGLLVVNKSDRPSLRRGVWFCCRTGLLALALAPVARLADHSFATPVLAASAAAAFLLVDQQVRSSAVCSVVVVGAALSAWSLVLWHADWIPAAAILGVTILLRFAVNAGDLNKDEDGRRANRIAYYQALALLSVGMLVLGHGAAAGYFETDDLATVTDRISMSVVAVIWAVLLVTKQLRAEARASADPAADARGLVRQLAATKAADSHSGVPASWSWMLSPGLGLVDFLGRERELKVLESWASGQDARRLHLLTGQGGSGKTRLAAELCERWQRMGGTAVWVRPGCEPGSIPALRAAGVSRALVIIDNADDKAGLGTLIAGLAGPGGDGLRVLVIARAAGEWCRRLGAVTPAASDLVTSAVRDRLALAVAVQPGMTELKIVEQAVNSIARQFDLTESRIQLRRRTNERYNMLELQAAALAETLSDAESADRGTGTVQVDLLKGLSPLLDRERRVWQEKARRAGLANGQNDMPAATLSRIMAASCLLGATSAGEAAEVATRVIGLPPSPGLTAWLTVSCAAMRSWTTPDGIFAPSRVAELLTTRELSGKSGAFRNACLTSMPPAQAVHAVTFLARATLDYKEASGLLAQILDDLDTRIAGPRNPELVLGAAVSVIPDSATALAPGAIALIRKIIEQLPAGQQPAARAYWLAELGRRLSAAGEHQDAVRAAREAVTVSRELAARLPGRQLPGLIRSLENLAGLLRAGGQQSSGRQALGEAVTLIRPLAAAEPTIFGPWLARLLAASADEAPGNPALSRPAADEAVTLYRRAILARPGLYEADLGRSLQILSRSYREDDQLDNSVAAGSEAVEILQALAADAPGRYRQQLAGALDDLSVSLGGADRRADALAAAQKAVAEYAALHRALPGQFVTGYGHALGNLSIRYRISGQAAKAVAPARQRADLYRTCARKDPARYRELLADALVSLAATLQRTGDERGAVAARQEAAGLGAGQHG